MGTLVLILPWSISPRQWLAAAWPAPWRHRLHSGDAASSRESACRRSSARPGASPRSWPCSRRRSGRSTPRRRATGSSAWSCGRPTRRSPSRSGPARGAPVIPAADPAAPPAARAHLATLEREVAEHMAGTRDAFDVPVVLEGAERLGPPRPRRRPDDPSRRHRVVRGGRPANRAAGGGAGGRRRGRPQPGRAADPLPSGDRRRRHARWLRRQLVRQPRGAARPQGAPPGAGGHRPRRVGAAIRAPPVTVAPMTVLRAYRQLLRNGPLTRLLVGEFVSSIGDWLYLVAILILVYQVTEDPFILGIVGAARVLPYVFLSIPAGIVADRFDRRLVLISTDIARGMLMLVIAGIVFLDGPGLADHRPRDRRHLLRHLLRAGDRGLPPQPRRGRGAAGPRQQRLVDDGQPGLRRRARRRQDSSSRPGASWPPSS